LEDDVFNFEVFDMSGKQVYQNQKHFSKGFYKEQFILENSLPKGMFLVNVSTNQYSYSKKFIR